MALKFIDGFEQYANGTGVAHIIAKSTSISTYAWSAYAGSASYFTVGTTYYRSAQTNASSLQLGGQTSLFMSIPTNETIVFGFGLRPMTYLSDSWCILTFQNGATYQNSTAGLHLEVMGDGSIRLLNEATNAVIQRSSPGVVGSLVWQYFEMKVSFGASANYEVRINGQTVLSGTGVNTLCGLTSVSGINICNSIWNQDIGIDDFYICDTSGATNNDFLGPISVYTLFPSADGSVTNFTPQGAASNYAAVNSKLPATTTYVQSGTTGHKDLYQVSDLPIGSGVVYGVLVRSYMQKLDNGPRATQLVLKTAGTESNSGSFTATMGSWLNAFAVFEKQADGSTSWDITAVNGMEIGHRNT